MKVFEQSNNMSNISNKFFTDLDETKKEQKEAQNLARIVQEQEQARLLQIAQEEEERQQLTQSNMLWYAPIVKTNKENISKSKEDIISKSKKNKTISTSNRKGKKQVISRPLSKLEEVSNSSNESFS